MKEKGRCPSSLRNPLPHSAHACSERYQMLVMSDHKTIGLIGFSMYCLRATEAGCLPRLQLLLELLITQSLFPLDHKHVCSEKSVFYSPR